MPFVRVDAPSDVELTPAGADYLCAVANPAGDAGQDDVIRRAKICDNVGATTISFLLEGEDTIDSTTFALNAKYSFAAKLMLPGPETIVDLDGTGEGKTKTGDVGKYSLQLVCPDAGASDQGRLKAEWNKIADLRSAVMTHGNPCRVVSAAIKSYGISSDEDTAGDVFGGNFEGLMWESGTSNVNWIHASPEKATGFDVPVNPNYVTMATLRNSKINFQKPSQGSAVTAGISVGYRPTNPMNDFQFRPLLMPDERLAADVNKLPFVVYEGLESGTKIKVMTFCTLEVRLDDNSTLYHGQPSPYDPNVDMILWMLTNREVFPPVVTGHSWKDPLRSLIGGAKRLIGDSRAQTAADLMMPGAGEAMRKVSRFF